MGFVLRTYACRLLLLLNTNFTEYPITEHDFYRIPFLLNTHWNQGGYHTNAAPGIYFQNNLIRMVLDLIETVNP